VFKWHSIEMSVSSYYKSEKNVQKDILYFLMSACRSDGSNGPAKPSVHRIRRRSISITPEIGDDIVRSTLVSHDQYLLVSLFFLHFISSLFCSRLSIFIHQTPPLTKINKKLKQTKKKRE
jgi:hypothetical protein